MPSRLLPVRQARELGLGLSIEPELKRANDWAPHALAPRRAEINIYYLESRAANART